MVIKGVNYLYVILNVSQIDIIRVFKSWCKALGFVSRTSDATRLRGRVWRMTGGGQSVCVSPLSLLPLYLPLPPPPSPRSRGGRDGLNHSRRPVWASGY